MRALELARSLRAGAEPAKVATQLVQSFAAVPTLPLDDVAQLTHRLAAQPHPPPPDFFDKVSANLEILLASTPTSSGLSGAGTSLLASAFARVQYDGGKGVLSLACLSITPRSELAVQELLRLAGAALQLDAHNDPAVRGFLQMQFQKSAAHMEACDLAEGARILAASGIYNHALSMAIEKQLIENSLVFELQDAMKLLPHFYTWKLGKVQKRAFQSLGLRFCPVAEVLKPHEALHIAETFADLGLVHEVLFQHLYLRLLLERSFIDCSKDGIAKLAATMSKVQYYHAGLLREIVEHVREEPDVVSHWGANDLSGALRSFGLAPVHVPPEVLHLFGCRYGSLLEEMDDAMLRDFFEVSSKFPDVLRVLVSSQRGKKLPLRLQTALPNWGLRACADVLLAVTLSLDVSPQQGSVPCACARGSANSRGQSTARRTDYRTSQPQDQLRVVLRTARSWKQGWRNWKQQGARADAPTTKMLDNLFLVDDRGSKARVPISSGCQATWALPGRRRRRLPPSDGGIRLLEAALPSLFSTLHSSSESLGEVAGTPPPEMLLEEPIAPTLEAQFLPRGGSTADAVSPRLLLPTSDELQSGGSEVDALAIVNDPCLPDSSASDESPERELEVLRRSELVQVSVQLLATLQLCFSHNMLQSLTALPLTTFQAMGKIFPLVGHILRPRREDDETILKYNLGPQRLEAFVRRPDEPLLLDVHRTLGRLVPYLPRMLGWDEWSRRRQDTLQGEETGGAILKMNREVEVPPFIVCFVIKRRKKSNAESTLQGQLAE
mmetsp:Transcript_26974/g.52069  ORF Transcript_26974/g.52069 Transcript_26974/m.52069 type:complete len:780 (-) Transcript_26974:52-2391(-)